MTSLNQFLREIAQVGPHCWNDITPDDFSLSFDYIVQPLGESRTIIDPTSEAALQWLYKHLPEDCPRYGKLAFVVETQYLAAILERMYEDGLLNEAQYVENMENNERDQHAGERR